MNENRQNEINLHSAGATVRHRSDFDHLKSHKNDFELSKEFIDQWVLPFYMEMRHTSGSWIEDMKQLKDEITEEVTLALLGDFNWRTRTVGAYLSAIKNYENQIDIIGVHLLKSEVCYAGDLYALVFAFYNNQKTIDYLNQYLDYYLQKPQLYFDQERVMETLVYLDGINGTNNYSKHLTQWEKMLQDRHEISKIRNLQTAEIIKQQEGKVKAEEFLKATNNFKFKYNLDTEWITEQIHLLKELREF
ncbi:hypothetical protein EG346_00420 [Chryseobacterium carnipullorum]|uniref:Uncharacterized protein n=1 Tax=Chryseobacterium carnipullorum TaxID=1124835 RepID=A0A1M7GGS5_CHRCU|nr:DUF6000 family protein [Chryseobacterium carnipullorum]AZA46772.1 hypothetical protein EG346_00420 [Chryseobacterium carnipullorum]AZA66134.1 hypothetical protein EG345_16495 [Chryseobacterium carnipullorum]SHM15157.1 hypothetical protein SAMN05444360_108145 [Chryseobacterium carnipullorum]STD05711.1 Uncharacterised protein [Chryseobacterium carnipullorum]